jgi:protein phosphatase
MLYRRKGGYMISYGISHKGLVRNENQDAYINIDTPIGELDNIYIIADGMGGHKGGAIASKLAIDTFIKFIKEASGTPKEIVKEGIRKANEVIYKAAVNDSSLFGMGTTMDVVTIKDDHMYIGHIGDSRVYYMNFNKELDQISKDHSYVQELVDSGAITEEEAYHHPNKNRITRAVGVDTTLEIDIIDIKIDRKIQLKLLICSDGLTNMLKNDDIYSIINKDNNIRKRSEELLNQSLENGGTDNISIILVEGEKGWWENA